LKCTGNLGLSVTLILTMFVATSCQHSHYSFLHIILSTILHRNRVRSATPGEEIQVQDDHNYDVMIHIVWTSFQAASSAEGLVPCIFGAGFLVWYAITRLFFDGCFQAYEPVVIGNPHPCLTEPSLGGLIRLSGLFPSRRMALVCHCRTSGLFFIEWIRHSELVKAW